MSPPHERPVRELIAELCDGMIQPNERLRLEQLLREDPILQHEYLDQAMIDGLLRYEFGIDRPWIPDEITTVDSRNSPAKTVSQMFLGLLIGLACSAVFWWFQSDREITLPVPLTNVSFEIDRDIPTQPILNGWYGDVARIVHSTETNLAFDGKRMLQLIRSVHHPSEECEVYQILDLSQAGIDTRITTGFIEATIMVNARSDMRDDPYRLSLELYTYAEQPKMQHMLAPETWGSDMMRAGKHVTADSDPDAWQEIRLVMPLSRSAKFGIIKISVRDINKSAGEEFSEVFVDHVQIRLTSKGLF